jgi:hypothetical protein
VPCAENESNNCSGGRRMMMQHHDDIFSSVVSVNDEQLTAEHRELESTERAEVVIHHCIGDSTTTTTRIEFIRQALTLHPRSFAFKAALFWADP